MRRTISKGEMPAQPATATMTPVIGETVRPNDVANCIGRMRRIVETPNSRAKSGTTGAKAKKGALPLPNTMEINELLPIVFGYGTVPGGDGAAVPLSKTLPNLSQTGEKFKLYLY